MSECHVGMVIKTGHKMSNLTKFPLSSLSPIDAVVIDVVIIDVVIIDAVVIDAVVIDAVVIDAVTNVADKIDK